MDELSVRINQSNYAIETNFTQIKEQLAEFLKDYEDVVVDEKSIKKFKKDLADLRKVKKEIDDKRKEIKKAWNKPYEEFEGGCKELTEMVDKPIEQLATQLKMFDEERILKKREHVKEIYAEHIGEYERFLPLDAIYVPSWDNVSATDQDIAFDISQKVLKVKSDMEALKSLHSEIEDDVIEAYIKSGNDLSKAIERNNQYISDKSRVVAKEEKTAMKSMDDMTEMLKTVKFIVSVDDADAVRSFLELSQIHFNEV